MGGRSAVDERVFGEIGEGVQFEVDVEVWPAEVVAVEQLDVENVADAGFLEPREILVGQEVFAVLHPEPNAVGGDVGDFNLGSASCWTHGDDYKAWIWSCKRCSGGRSAPPHLNPLPQGARSLDGNGASGFGAVPKPAEFRRVSGV